MNVLAFLKDRESYDEKSMVHIFFVTKAIHINKDNCDLKSAEKKRLSSYFIWLYERQHCLESDLYGSTQEESPICRAQSQICTQYMLGVRFVRACLALYLGWTLKQILCDQEAYLECAIYPWSRSFFELSRISISSPPF